jgi:hypothetical protein
MSNIDLQTILDRCVTQPEDFPQADLSYLFSGQASSSVMSPIDMLVSRLKTPNNPGIIHGELSLVNGALERYSHSPDPPSKKVKTSLAP